MPVYTSKLELTSAASSSGVAFADIQYLKGAFYTVRDTSDLNNIPANRATDGQIVWVEGSSATYQASVTLADYISTFADSVTWSVFNGFGGSGGASTLGDLSDVTTGSLDDGDVLAWSQSNNRWEPQNISGTGDIAAVFAGDGLSGGGTQGSVSLDVNAGSGITLDSNGVNVNTGSSHFINAVTTLAGASSIFAQTGSYHSTNRNIEVTGSMSINMTGNTNPFTLTSGSKELFKVSSTGVLLLTSQSTTPTPVVGGLYFDSDKNLYFGF